MFCKLFFLIAIFGVGGKFCYAQAGKLPFEDSIQFVLEGPRRLDPAVTGVAFSTQWRSLSSQQQNTIKKQVMALRKKGMSFPFFVHYYYCINSSGGAFVSFLETASEVIAKESLRATELFCLNSRLLLEKHALNLTVPFKVLTNAPFTFVYVERKAVSDTAAVAYAADTLADDTNRRVKIPPHEGGLARFDGPLSLRFVTHRDTVTLKGTQGTFSLMDKSFHGSGGRFDWSSTGIPADSTYYTFIEFSYNAASPILKAHNGALFTTKCGLPISGVFEYNALPGKAETGTFPRFTSYENNLHIGGFPPSIECYGGFSLYGRRIKNYSVKGGLNRLTWSENEGRKLVARGKTFQVNQEKGLIEGDDIAVAIYHNGDSITHPSKSFKLDYGNHKLLLEPARTNLKNAPFLSSLFGIDFNADELLWDAKTDQIKLSIRGSGKVSPMVFESNQYYDRDGLRILQGHGFRFHPLLLVTRYAKTTGRRKIFVNELVPSSGSSYDIVQMAMGLLAEKGMILYDPFASQITVTDKAMLWLEVYNKSPVDYDNLKIQSYYNNGPNAVVDLKEKTITVHGVDDFVISDSLNVQVKPSRATLQITPNRGFTYDGTLRSGIFEIYGKKLAFDYGLYAFNMKDIDSIRLHIKRKDNVDEQVDNSLISVGHNVSGNSPEQIKKALADTSLFANGVLYINRPDNKSGAKRLKNFPRLDSKGSEVVYFDKPTILNGAYDRSVYFFVLPFAMDSLGESKSGSTEFEGTFMTGGMLPDFKDELHTMPDRSLGFKHSIPTEGYNLYKTGGLLFGNLSFNNKGLRDKGRLQYLTTTLFSDDFVFYLDSVTATGKSGRVKKGLLGGTAFPDITFDDYKLKWLPKEDKMHITNNDAPFDLYKGLGTLNGMITVSKKLVGGKGRMKLPSCEMASKDFEFYTNQIKAEDARFKVFTGNSKIPAMDAKHVSLEFDLANEKAKIRPRVTGNMAFEFPLARFKTSISTAEWDLKAKKITMKAEGDIAHSFFVSTKKELDSLRFNAEKAEYDIEKEMLTLSGVPYITVADMRITPENKTFIIRKNAQFGVFKNVTIVADTANQYHKLTDGEVEIVSRNTLRGSATYSYGNILGDTFKIKMNEFELVPMDSLHRARRDARMQTSAKGAVPESMNLRMSPRMLFKGAAIMYASNPKLNLHGYVSPEIKGENKKTWIKYSQVGTEIHEAINYDKAVDEEGNKPNAGIFFDKDGALYSLFIEEKKEPEDEAFFTPSGSLYFDEKTAEFKIEDSLKASGNALSGQLFAYNDDKQIATFDGRLQFIPPVANLRIKGSGIGKWEVGAAKMSLNSLVIFDSKIPGAAMQIMADRLKSAIKDFDIRSGMGDHTQLLYKLGSLLPEKIVKEFEQNSLRQDVPLISLGALLKSLVLSNVDMLYSAQHKALYSTGMIGVSNIGKTAIDGAFEGYFEVSCAEPTAPVMNLFIKASGDAWFYFGLAENKLLIVSSDTNFNNIMAKKTPTSKDDEVAILPGSEDEAEAFLSRFRKNYLGTERAYHLTEDMKELQSAIEKTEQSAEETTDSEEDTKNVKKKKPEEPKEKEVKEEKEVKKKAEPKEKEPKKKKEKKSGKPTKDIVDKAAPSDSTQTELKEDKKPKKENDGF